LSSWMRGAAWPMSWLPPGRAPVRCGASRMLALAPAVSVKTSLAGLSSG